MSASTIALKQRIREGKLVVGASAPISASIERLEQILDHYPYEFFHLDSQHLPLNEETLLRFCQTAGEFGVPVFLRIKHPRDAYLVGALADLGPLGLEVPQVETEAIANEAVEYFYYPPVGKRSSGGVAVHNAAFTPTPGEVPRLEYADWWNNHGVLMLQVESLEAVMQAKHLAKARVDCLSWGAAPSSADLAFSLEANPHHPLKTDDDCLKYVLKQLEHSETRLLVRVSGSEQRQRYMSMGATVFRETPPASAGARLE